MRPCTRTITCIVVLIGGLAASVAAQVSATVHIQEGINAPPQDIPIPPAITNTVTHCLSFAPPRYAIAAVELRHNPDSNWGFNLKINVTDSPVEALLFICSIFPTCPAPAISPCGPEIVQRIDYHVLRGGISLYAAAAGGGFSGGANTTRIGTGEIHINDVLEITSPFATQLQMPIIAHGDVLGAESFGNPDQTWGKASLLISGVAATQNVNLATSVESTSVIPDQNAINVTQTVPMSVPAGISTYPISLIAKVRVEVKATSAGLFGTITGAATAAANFEDSLRIGRITAQGGGPLPPGVRVRGLQTGAIYEDTTETPGDANCDNQVNVLDVPAFSLGLVNPGQFAADFPTCSLIRVDVNTDGALDGHDVTAMARLLTP